MNQHTYSFPKVTPVDPEELREDLRSSRRDQPANADETRRGRSFLRALRVSNSKD